MTRRIRDLGDYKAIKKMKVYIAHVADGVAVVDETDAKVENGFVSFSGGTRLVVVAYAEFCAYGQLFWFDDGIDHCFSAAAKTKKQALKTLCSWFEKQMKEAAHEVGELSKKLETSKKKMHAAHGIVQAIRAAGKVA